MARDQRLLVVSARAPFTGRTSALAPGGVVSALLPTLRRTGGLWLATGADADACDRTEDGFEVRPVAVEADARARWYAGACNGALWPLAHASLDRCRFRTEDWAAYVEVNRAVANAIAVGAQRGAVVWVHDYQLALVPRLARERRPDLRIGFFWHVPWPPADLLRVHPCWDAIVSGVLGADVVGFQVPRYVQAFADALRELGHDLAAPRGRAADGLDVTSDGHQTRVIALPIGIDVRLWESLAADPTVRTEAQALRRTLSVERVLLAVDRMDYAKGIVERLLAFERVLERTPALRGTTALVQIGVPTRESLDAYRQLRQRIEETVGRIAGRFATAAWNPVRLFATCFSPRELAPFYVAADAALVTPLRDGMNLVAFEYATCAPRRGRLLLSTLAGAADVLREAYRVNPYDEDALADSIARMATAATDVDDARLTKLRARVATMPVQGWVERFLSELSPPYVRRLSGTER